MKRIKCTHNVKVINISRFMYCDGLIAEKKTGLFKTKIYMAEDYSATLIKGE